MNADHEVQRSTMAAYISRALGPLVYLGGLAFFLSHSDLPHRGQTFSIAVVVVVATVICFAIADRVMTKRGVTTEGKKKMVAIVLGVLAVIMLISAGIKMLTS